MSCALERCETRTRGPCEQTDRAARGNPGAGAGPQGSQGGLSRMWALLWTVAGWTSGERNCPDVGLTILERSWATCAQVSARGGDGVTLRGQAGQEQQGLIRCRLGHAWMGDPQGCHLKWQQLPSSSSFASSSSFDKSQHLPALSNQT